MRRASHAVLAGGGVWLIDPVDADGVEERVRALGEPAGVLVLFGRHDRDSAALAERLGVPRYTPEERPPAPPFQVVAIGRGELALWLPEHAALVVSEALGTAQYFRAPGERLGLHPWRRLAPPRRLNAFEPQHVLVAHGSRSARRGGRRRAPRRAGSRSRADDPVAVGGVPRARAQGAVGSARWSLSICSRSCCGSFPTRRA